MNRQTVSANTQIANAFRFKNKLKMQLLDTLVKQFKILATVAMGVCAILSGVEIQKLDRHLEWRLLLNFRFRYILNNIIVAYFKMRFALW